MTREDYSKLSDAEKAQFKKEFKERNKFYEKRVKCKINHSQWGTEGKRTALIPIGMGDERMHIVPGKEYIMKKGFMYCITDAVIEREHNDAYMENGERKVNTWVERIPRFSFNAEEYYISDEREFDKKTMQGKKLYPISKQLFDDDFLEMAEYVEKITRPESAPAEEPKRGRKHVAREASSEPVQQDSAV